MSIYNVFIIIIHVLFIVKMKNNMNLSKDFKFHNNKIKYQMIIKMINHIYYKYKVCKFQLTSKMIKIIKNKFNLLSIYLNCNKQIYKKMLILQLTF